MDNELRKKATALALAGGLAISGASLARAESEDPLRQSQIEHSAHQIQYIEYVENADMEGYNENFVNFYRNGTIKIGEEEYNVGDLYLETGISNGESKTFLVYYRFPQKDLITKEEKTDFKRTDVMLLKNAFLFYEIYEDYTDLIVDNVLLIEEKDYEDISSRVKSFDGTIHVETPETSFGRIKTKTK